ncbi:hypothetical protein NCC49_000186 [Naganishia albida]|nr:hypothetical protein NCC49_000186 [Naganishia albida]
MSHSHSHSHDVLLPPQDSRPDQRYIPSPTLSYYANHIPSTPAPPVPPLPQHAVPPRRPNGKPKPAPIDMARIRRASSKRPPKVIVTCDVEGKSEEEEKTGFVEVGRPAVNVIDVRSARASVGDMRNVSRGDKPDQGRSRPTSSPSIVEIEPGLRFPSWMGGTTYQHITSHAAAHTSSRSASPLPRARGSRTSPLSPRKQSPESGGPLHQILLTPLTPSDHAWSTDDLVGRNRREKPSAGRSGKRRTMVDVAMGLLADQRTKWLRDRSEAVQDSSVRKDKTGYAHRQEGAYGLSDLKSAWAARERRVMTREEAKRKARRTKWIIIIALIILIICSVIVGVCVSLLANRSSNLSPSSEKVSSAVPSNASTTVSAAAPASTPSVSTTYNLDTCLDLFTVSAPASPLMYPCGQCSAPLSAVPNDFAGNGTSAKAVGSVLQFCALQSIFKNTEGTASGSTSTSDVLSGWMRDTNVCAGWSGIRCDPRGRVVSLSLVYPNVPETLDSSFKYLVALESLKIVGNSKSPSDTIPEGILPSTLSTIDIQATNLVSLSVESFAGSIEKLHTVMLVSNAKLGNSLPDLVGASSLQTLSVTGQSLTEDPSKKLPRSLTYLDLSYNSLSGAVPDLAHLASLKSLFLDANAYTAFPSTLPSSLQELSLNGNAKLNGTVPAGFCNAPQLTSCDFRGSQLSPGPGNVTTTTRTVTSVSRGATATSTIFATVAATSTATSSCGICRFT